MQQYLSVIQSASIFQGISAQELNGVLACLNAAKSSYQKGEYLLLAGDKASAMGLLLEGSLLILQEDIWGNCNLMGNAKPGDIFAEAFACLPDVPLNVSVMAQQDCTVLWLEIPRLLSSCNSACPHHQRMIQNLLAAFAAKNRVLNTRLTHMGKRSTKEKLLSYLSAQAQHNQSNQFSIPFNRQQLADYLSVERSAMSLELCKLRDAGLISFDKNNFVLHTPLA